MNLYDRFYIAHYLWMLRVENNKEFELGNYFAFSAIFSVCFTLFINLLFTSLLLDKLEILPSIPFDNVELSMVIIFVLFMVHYFVYILPGRYCELAPQLKDKIHDTQWLILYVFGPMAFAFVLWLILFILVYVSTLNNA